MKKSIFPLCLLLGSCQTDGAVSVSEKQAESTTEFHQTSVVVSDVPRTSKPVVTFKSIGEILADSSTVWKASEYYPTLDFTYEKGKVVMQFDGQCHYTYPIRVADNFLTVLYDVQEDCTHDIGIKNTYGLKRIPQKDKPFFVLRLVNDTTLEAAYLYPEWTKKVNTINPDYPCFVKRFYAGRLKG